MPSVRRPALLLSALMLGLTAAAPRAFAQEPADAPKGVELIPRREAKAGDDELRRALVDRFNAAADQFEVCLAFHDAGTVTLDRVLGGLRDAARCEIELGVTPADEVAVCERTVKLVRDIETAEEARFRVGTTSAPNVAAARFARRDAEVQLLRAKRKAAEAK